MYIFKPNVTIIISNANLNFSIGVSPRKKSASKAQYASFRIKRTLHVKVTLTIQVSFHKNKIKYECRLCTNLKSVLKFLISECTLYLQTKNVEYLQTSIFFFRVCIERPFCVLSSSVFVTLSICHGNSFLALKIKWDRAPMKKPNVGRVHLFIVQGFESVFWTVN